MVFNKSKKAAQGIGTLIIFIALILVAAVAAGVLIQTASSLQSQSLDVGRQTQERITTDIEVVQMFVRDTSNGNITADEDNVTLVLRLGSGSNSVRLEDLLVRFDTRSGTQSLTVVEDLLNDEGNTTNYGLNYRIEGANHQPGYLVTGDLVELTFQFGGDDVQDIVEGETATLRLISRNGAVRPVQVTTPSALVESITYLYP